MTPEDLARRVYDAERRAMAADGLDISRAVVVLHPEDWMCLRMSTSAWVTGARCDSFRGHPVQTDHRLARGDVRLRVEVAA